MLQNLQKVNIISETCVGLIFKYFGNLSMYELSSIKITGPVPQTGP